MTMAGEGIDLGSDQDLWERLRLREPEALGDLFSRYVRDVHAFAVRRTGSYAAADDAVQATFVSAWRQFTRGDPGPLTRPTARPWLITIAHNELRNVARARRRLTRFVTSQPLAVDHPDHADVVADRIDSERRVAQVRTALHRLPRHERETVELVYWAGLTITETAAVLDVAPGTVKARLSRARRRLPTLLAEAAGGADTEDQS
jgi:RNA polymerase sigma factor (sigma-70 family)